MVLTEFNEEVYKKGIYSEGFSDGKAEGKAEGVFSLVQKGRITLEDAAEELNIPVSEIEKKMIEAGFAEKK